MSTTPQDASRLVAQLAGGFSEELDQEEAGQPRAALTAVWTSRGVRWSVAASGGAATREEVLELLGELSSAVEGGQLRAQPRIRLGQEEAS